MQFLLLQTLLFIGCTFAATTFSLSHSKNLTNIVYNFDDGKSVYYTINTNGDVSDVLVTGDYGSFRDTLVADDAVNSKPWIGWINNKTGDSSGLVYTGDIPSDDIEGDNIIKVNGTIDNGIVTRDYYDGDGFVKRYIDSDLMVKQKRLTRCVGVRVGCGNWCLAIGKSVLNGDKTKSIVSLPSGIIGYSA